MDLVVEDKELRVEFIGSCESEYKEYANILSSCAFNIINTQFSCSHGMVYSDVASEYYKETTMKHILFTDPFLWENIETLDYVTWLMMVPISNEEFEFLKVNGSEELENLFEKININLLDLNRKSVV
ncbi:suppressor of fused domain protein [Enterococcus raffinosus]|nr:suppressor of fused domain protein [Enterococcus raffinosus]MDT2570526.1 suppressor of fused domain protein [Enterococcus raffinosus]